MQFKDFKTRIIIKAEREEVYAAFTNPFTIELWSGHKAVMREEPNSEFSLWDGDICGHNIEFIKNNKVVQEWYFGDQPAPSIVTIKLFDQKNGVQVEVNHTNIPLEAFDDIIEGWENYYLGAIKTFFEEV